MLCDVCSERDGDLYGVKLWSPYGVRNTEHFITRSSHDKSFNIYVCDGNAYAIICKNCIRKKDRQNVIQYLILVSLTIISLVVAINYFEYFLFLTLLFGIAVCKEVRWLTNFLIPTEKSRHRTGKNFAVEILQPILKDVGYQVSTS
jgi:hypothetical protein